MKSVEELINQNLENRKLIVNVINHEINAGREVYLCEVNGKSLLTSQPAMFGGDKITDAISIIVDEDGLRVTQLGCASAPLDIISEVIDNHIAETQTLIGMLHVDQKVKMSVAKFNDLRAHCAACKLTHSLDGVSYVFVALFNNAKNDGINVYLGGGADPKNFHEMDWNHQSHARFEKIGYLKF